jgi:uncharacterized protein
MGSIRTILNEIKWTKDLHKTELWYIHRGAPNNMKMISGDEIISVGRWFLETPTATIPYHRIITIIDDSVVVFDRWNMHKKDKQL